VSFFPITAFSTIFPFFVCAIYSFDLGLIGLTFRLLYLGLGLFSDLLFYLPGYLEQFSFSTLLCVGVFGNISFYFLPSKLLFIILAYLSLAL